MTTANRRVAAYLPDPLVERFDSFKAAQELGDSAALIAILEQFFDVLQPAGKPTLPDRVEALEKRVYEMSIQLAIEEKF